MYLALSNVTRMVGSVSEVRPVRTEADQFMTSSLRRQCVDVKVLRERVALKAARLALENLAQSILFEFWWNDWERQFAQNFSSHGRAYGNLK
jgi:hypothetical protein